MVSQTYICNLALSHIGGGKITSLDDGTEKARQLEINYDVCLEMALRDFPWNFARKIELLALTDDTTPGWDYVYGYPVDCTKVLKIYAGNNARVQEKSEFKIISDGDEKYIACDIEDAYIEYTMRVTNPTIYDPLFVKALSYLLAGEISNALSGNASKTSEMVQRYQLAIKEANLAGATEEHIPLEWPNSYLRGRR